ncbi:hypothetical protein CJ205_00960 [Dolosicoccus paucivorans]|uniref:HTH araC/xylS-type domain-containing protein n=1 Tax=Dolosicoccus paucivorans TaxID=84521 RepID=A0A2N6SPR6_9LACT|nr:AraC family transcriptional regulator [Dolosicoccus paucivorans]PMB84406.1 hypothetical protein CJ206_04045 [Dolosicoccus paucivorans]PMC59065.1 hypothetical protein CJ205_00960 [Dolosicoccus paucivorans]
MFLSTSQLIHPLFNLATDTPPHIDMLTIRNKKSNKLLQFKQPVYLAPARHKAVLIFTDHLAKKSNYQYIFLDQPIMLNKGVLFNILPLDQKDCTIALGLKEIEQPKMHTVQEYTHQLSVYPFSLDIIQLQWVNEATLLTDNTQIYICLEGEYQLQIGHKREYLYPLQVLVLQEKEVTIKPLKKGKLIAIECETKLQSPSFKSTINLTQKEFFLSLKHQWNLLTYAYLYHWIYTLLLTEPFISPTDPVVESTAMKTNAERELFLKMRDYLLEDLKNRHQVQHLVDGFGLSRSTIQMLFTKHAKMSPVEYINRLRIEESQRLMKESSLNLTQISQQLGFKTLSYFSRAFTKQVGVSPSSYAKSLQSFQD